jgi:hypothetical protein
MKRFPERFRIKSVLAQAKLFAKKQNLCKKHKKNGKENMSMWLVQKPNSDDSIGVQPR